MTNFSKGIFDELLCTVTRYGPQSVASGKRFKSSPILSRECVGMFGNFDTRTRASVIALQFRICHERVIWHFSSKQQAENEILVAFSVFYDQGSSYPVNRPKQAGEKRGEHFSIKRNRSFQFRRAGRILHSRR